MWYSWYRGYEIIGRYDCIEEHRTLEGEYLEDTDPGHLPRTLNELENEHAFPNDGGSRLLSTDTEAGVEEAD